MRAFLLILMFILILVVYTITTIKRLAFTFGLKSLDVSQFGSIQNFGLGQSKVRVGMELCIYNPLAYMIKMSRIKYDIFYEGVLIGKSSELNEDLKKIRLISSSNSCFIANTDFFINAELLKLAYKIKQKEAAEITYHVTGMLFFIPFKREDKYVFNNEKTI